MPRALVQDGTVSNPVVLARLDDLEGSLRKDQRRFGEAEKLLVRAILLYRVSGRSQEIPRVLLVLGAAYAHGGDLRKAMETVHHALGKLGREPGSRLYLCARHNLAWYLTEAGRYAEAAAMLENDADLYASFPGAWTKLHLTWVQGKIAAGRRDLALAEELLKVTRDGFLAQGDGYDAALVVVGDLAPLYLAHGKTREARELAEEASVIFAAEDVHREALAALMLFQEAARRESLTAELVRDLAQYLKDARRDPSIPFKPTAPGA